MSRVAMVNRLSAFPHLDAPPILAASQIKRNFKADVDFRRSCPGKWPSSSIDITHFESGELMTCSQTLV